MKPQILLAAAFSIALPALAQPDALNPANGLPFRLVAPTTAETLALPKPFKLDLKEVTLAAALQELQKQSGVTIDVANAPDETLEKKLSLHLETRSFNRAFDEIMGEAGVTASLQRNDYNRPWAINWNQKDAGAEALQSGVGLFEVRLMSLNTTLSKSLTLSGAEKRDDKRSENNFLNVYLTLSPDLRLPLVGVPRARVTRAEDEQGRSLVVKTDSDQRNYNAYSFYQNMWEQQRANLRMRAPEPDAKALAHLEGLIVYAVVVKTETWEMPDLLSKTEWKRGFQSDGQKFEMTIKPVFKEERLTLGIEVTTNRPTDNNRVGPPLMANNSVLQALRLTDANGVVLPNNGYGGGMNGPKMTANATFYAPSRSSDDGEKPDKTWALPLKLVLEAPVDVVQTEVPFQFEDVPLP